MNPLLIRTEVTPKTGAGHFMRCLALAQGWLGQGGRIVFVVSEESTIPFPEKISTDIEIIRILHVAGSVSDAEQTALLAKKVGTSWIVLDGYGFDSDFQKNIKQSGINLLVIDDYAHADFYHADVVLNQNLYAQPELYEGKYDTVRLLVGPRYALLRQEFRKWRTWKREIPQTVTKILVIMGGSDQKNATLTVLKALRCIGNPGLEIRVVTGFNNPRLGELTEESRKSPAAIRFIDGSRDMSELIAWADIGISAAGSTSWELASLGLPSLLISVSENQIPVARVLQEQHVSLDLGVFESISVGKIEENLLELMQSKELREELSRNGRRLIDGQGVERTIMVMTGVALRLQQITEDDCMRVYAWVTDPDVRRNSFSAKDITLVDHKRWFRERLSDPSCVYNIIINRDDLPVGQVRFDITECDAVISILIAKEYRGKNIGQQAIKLASESLFRIRPVNNIHAYVKAENIPSLNAFKKSGFRLSEEIVKNKQRAHHLVMSRLGKP